MMLYLIMYMSTACEALPQKELDAILAESRSWNKSHKISGFLAYVEGNLKDKNYCQFIQVLEGPEAEVTHIFQKIKKDRRHMHLTVIKEGAILNRNFDAWEMGFEKIDLNTNFDLHEFFDLDTKTLADHGNINNNMLLDFMKAFNKITPSS
ncbi:MAG: BLUF domain-containing protein [Pedobacter sp.]|nr:BLUF domain-containing protein [Pedobacter sp.]